MRLELSFSLRKSQIPADNKKIWVSFLKHALSQAGGGRFYDQFFSGTPSKDYTFSIVLPAPRFQGETVLLEKNSLKMLFSADDRKRTGLIFYQAFIAQKNREFLLPDGNAMTLEKITQLPERLITDSKVIFKTVAGGGLVIRQHNQEKNKDWFFSYEDEGFSEQMKEVLGYQAKEAGFSEQDGRNIKFTPIKCKKVLVKQYGIYVDATCGTFLLEGNPELLQYFYQAGLGSKHSMGYGMLDVIGE